MTPPPSPPPSPQPSLPDDWEARDSIGSYTEAIRAIGERVRAGEPVPEFMRSKRDRSGQR